MYHQEIYKTTAYKPVLLNQQVLCVAMHVGVCVCVAVWILEGEKRKLNHWRTT